MTETGKVTKIDGSFVTVQCRPFLACHTCGSRICRPRNRDIIVRNPRGLKLQPGDYAELDLPASRLLGPLFRVFGLPVLAFIAAYVFSPRIFGDTEKVRVLAGCTGCLLGALAAYLLGRRKNTFPEVLRAVPAPMEADACPESR